MNSNLVEQYSKWMRSWGAAETTITARAKIARSRLASWGIEGHTPTNIEDWLAVDAKGVRRKAWTRSTYYGHLNSWCEWLYANDLLDDNPMENVRKPKRGSPIPRPLTESEVQVTLERATGDLYAWMTLALTAGLRVHEIAKVRGQDVSAAGIYVVGKGDKRDMLPCSPEILELADRYPVVGYWFAGDDNGHINPQSITKRVSAHFRLSGVTEGSIHRCRHVFGTRALRSGVNIRTVQKLMRHSSLATTANYTAVDEDELRAAIQQMPRLPPRDAA